MKYKVFISYSHKNLDVANWLHRRLDGYRPPKQKGFPHEARWRIFLDREELGANSNLSERITHALDESDTLLILCSADAARSRHVNMEIAYFKQFADRKILFAIINGTPHDVEDECMPPALAEISQEPLGVDLRKNNRSEAFLKIVSGILVIDYGDLANRERRRAVRRTILGFSLAVVIIVSIAAAIISALVQTISVARQIAEAKTLGGLRSAEVQDIENADRSFRQSLFISDSQIAREGLIRTLRKPVNLAAKWAAPSDEFTSVTFVTETRIAVAGKNGYVRLIDISDDAREVWSAVPAGFNAEGKSQAVNDLEFDPTNSRVIAASEGGQVYWLDPATGAVVDQYTVGHAALSLRTSPDAKLLSIGTKGGVVAIDQNKERVIDLLHGHAGTVQGMAFNKASDTLYWGGSTKQIWACPVRSNPCQQLQKVEEWVYSIDTDPTGRFSAHGEGGKVMVLDHFLQRGEAVTRGGAHAFALRFSPTGSLLVSGDANGKIAIYDVHAQNLIQSIAAEDGEIYDIAFSPSGTQFASAGLNGVVSVWKIRSNVVAAPTYAKLGKRLPGMLTREQPTAIHDIRIFNSGSAVVTDSQMRRHVLKLPTAKDYSTSDNDGSDRVVNERLLASQRLSITRAWAAPKIDLISIWLELHPEHAAELQEMADTDNSPAATSSNGSQLAVMTTGHLSVLKAGESAVRTIRVEGSVPTALAIADAGDVAYASMQNGSVIVLSMDATTQKNIKCDQSEIFALYAVEGGDEAIVASANGVLCLVSQGGSVIKRVPTTAAMAFAASRELGAVALAGVDGVVRVFNSKLESIAEFNGHRGSVNSLHFTIDGRILYSGGEDETLRAWSAANAASIRTGSWHPPKMSDIELRDLYKELPGLWPLLRRLGYI